MHTALKILLLFLIITIIILSISILIYFQPEELDDVHPWIMNANDPHIKKSKWLWVIPLYMNEPISNHPGWVEKIKKSGKKIGLHGVHHTKEEFGIDRTDNYIDKGLNEFIRAFGYSPTHFKAPCLKLTKENAKKIRKRGMKIRGRLHQITRRVYHSPKGRLKNGWLIGEFSSGLNPKEQLKLQHSFYKKENK